MSIETHTHANVGLRGSLIPLDTWPLKACRAVDRHAWFGGQHQWL